MMYQSKPQEYPEPVCRIVDGVLVWVWQYPVHRRMKQPIKLRAELLIALLFAMVLHLAILSIDQVADVWPVVRYRTPVYVDYGSADNSDLPF